MLKNLIMLFVLFQSSALRVKGVKGQSPAKLVNFDVSSTTHVIDPTSGTTWTSWARQQKNLQLASFDSFVLVMVNVINWVSMNYERGKCGNSFLRKEKFRAEIRENVSTIKELRETVRWVVSVFIIYLSCFINCNLRCFKFFPSVLTGLETQL